jgi:hypothetical protein
VALSTIGEKFGVWLGGFALLLSLIAYILGSAPFTPAIVLTYVSVPAAFLTYLLGASRLSILAVYFGALAWFVVPLSEALPIRLDYLLALCFGLGFVLGVFLYANYRRVRAAT